MNAHGGKSRRATDSDAAEDGSPTAGNRLRRRRRFGSLGARWRIRCSEKRRRDRCVGDVNGACTGWAVARYERPRNPGMARPVGDGDVVVSIARGQVSFWGTDSAGEGQPQGRMLRLADNPTGLAPGYAPAGELSGRWRVERRKAIAFASDFLPGVSVAPSHSLRAAVVIGGRRHRAVCGGLEPDLYVGDGSGLPSPRVIILGWVNPKGFCTSPAVVRLDRQWSRRMKKDLKSRRRGCPELR